MRNLKYCVITIPEVIVVINKTPQLRMIISFHIKYSSSSVKARQIKANQIKAKQKYVNTFWNRQRPRLIQSV